MAHRLALEVGVWDVDGLMEDMPLSQLRDWMAFWELQNEATKEATKKGDKKKEEPKRGPMPTVMTLWAKNPGWNRGPRKA